LLLPAAALPGPLPKLIRELSTHEFFRKYASFPINRGQDLNLAAKVLLMEQAGTFVSTKKADLDHFFVSAATKSEGDFKGSSRPKFRQPGCNGAGIFGT
jgi:hypothetical protein